MVNGLDEGIRALNAGNWKQGRQILGEIVKANSSDETIWMWLALGLEDRRLKMDCWQQVLKLNPNHVKANKELIRLQVYS